MIQFTTKEKEDIAEYIFSFTHDILIKSDAIRLIDVLDKHKLITNAEDLKTDVHAQAPNISERLMMIVHNQIPVEQRRQIMKDYYYDSYKR